MRRIPYQNIVAAVKELCIEAAHVLPDDVVESLKRARECETNDRAKNSLELILKNAELAASEMFPLCQDTGLAIVFVEQGADVMVDPPGGRTDRTLADAINDGVAEGYQDGFLRKSVLGDPLHNRTNTNTNTPAIIHHRWTAGETLKLDIMLKGGGCENRSQFKMLTPAEGQQGAEAFVVDTVRRAGADACPPFVVGVGIGGDFERACLLAKRSLLRRTDSAHPDPFYDSMEKRLLARINDLGIGPQGMGGKTTALAVLIETGPCHIASLPVAVNIECHSHRHKSTVL